MPKKSYIQKLLILGMALAFFIVGCVDTSVQPIPSSFNFRSEVALVNFAEGVGSADFTMSTSNGETITFGTLAFGAASSNFEDVPAGSKTLRFNSESYKFNTEIDKKIRVFVVGTSAERKVVKFTQRYTFQSASNPADSSLYPENMTNLAFLNGSPDAEITKINAISSGGDTIVFSSSPLELGDIVSYQHLNAGTYTLDIISQGTAGDTVITSIQTPPLNVKGRYTAAIYGMAASLNNKVFTDD